MTISHSKVSYMKKSHIFLFLSLLSVQILSAETLFQTLQSVENAPLLKAAHAKSQAFKYLYKAEKSLDYPSLELFYSGTYLKQKPLIYMYGRALQMQSQNQYKGSLRLSYPLFSGFAISSLIDKSKFASKKATLEAEDVKRNLYLGVVALYTKAVSLKELTNSEKKAYSATQKSYKKAKALYKLGLIAPSELYRLQTTLASTKANVISLENGYKITLTELNALLNTQIKHLSNLPKIEKISLAKLTQKALQKRPDLLALKMLLNEQKSQISLAKSDYYPKVALFAQVAQIGDSPQINGDGYTNRDRSAIGFVINYNIFQGFQTSNKLEAAKATKLATQEMLQNYKNRIKSELKSDYLAFVSLQAQKKATQTGLKAASTYEKLIKGEFQNQLADADKLARAIAATDMARGALINIKAQLFSAYAKMLLEVESQLFLERVYKGKIK